MEPYVIRGGKKGYERLLLLARDRWPDTAALFARAGVSPGMRCIDLASPEPSLGRPRIDVRALGLIVPAPRRG